MQTSAFSRKLFVSQARPLAAARIGRNVAAKAFLVRPYTVRKGDTLTSIARKRGFEVPELVKLNHDLDANNLKEGQTILVPSGALSERDREIISGVDRGAYRTYPVRKGEALTDILEKRKITLEEFTKLNPDVLPTEIKDNQIIKLPTNKFTVREREMLTGSGIVPQEFFDPTNTVPFALGAAVGVAGYAFLSKQLRKKDDDESA